VTERGEHDMAPGAISVRRTNHCVEGIYRIAQSDHPHPLKMGTDELISVDYLVDLISRMAGKTLVKRHLDKPQGVRGRNSDNSRLRAVLGWEPPTPQADGLHDTYGWIAKQLREADRIPAAMAGNSAEG
jgi:GDP-D-mannose 3', 5'-epimerase